MSEQPPRQGVAAVAVLVLALGSFTTAYLLHAHSNDALARLRPLERESLYEQTLTHFASVCETPSLADETRALCTEEAKLLRRFSQCDDACHARTAAFVAAEPTR